MNRETGTVSTMYLSVYMAQQSGAGWNPWGEGDRCRIGLRRIAVKKCRRDCPIARGAFKHSRLMEQLTGLKKNCSHQGLRAGQQTLDRFCQAE
jgi:hypothetical protein